MWFYMKCNNSLNSFDEKSLVEAYIIMKSG